MSTRRTHAVLVAVVVALLAGCGASSEGPTDGAAAAGGSALTGEITVSNAASLTEAFDEIGAAVEAANPGASITFNPDSSGTLAQQILDGAPVDVFASADEENMDEVVAADLVAGEPTVFARNRLVIVTKPGNPEGIETLADLATVDGVVALCAEDAPCGRFAAQALEAADVAIAEGSITRGQNAAATLSQVTEGDAVAGIVYVTDELSAGDAADAVDIPDEDNVIATYPIAVLSDTQDDELSQAFVDFVLSDEGQAILAEHGFIPPT